MSPRIRPAGRTFKERWPQEAEETRYLASTTYAVVAGGVLGLFMVPLIVSGLLSTVPMAFAVVAALLVAVTFAIPRATGAGRRWLTLAWKIGAWVLAAAALGLAIEWLTLARCDEVCRAARDASIRPSPLGFNFLLLVAGSIGIAIVVDRAGNALRRRTPSPASPR